MKKNYLTLFLVTSFIMAFFAIPIHASDREPMYAGTTLVIPVGGVNYTYIFNSELSENIGVNVDVYVDSIDPNNGFWVIGNPGYPNLATLGGTTRDGVVFNGFLQNGVYHDKVQVTTTSIALTFNGRNYTSVKTTATNTVNINTSTLTTVTTQIYTGQGTLNVDANGRVTGTENGYLINGTWYLNSKTTEAANLTLPNGNLYTSHASNTVYTRTGTGPVVPTYTNTYSNSATGKSFTIAANGVITGSEGGVMLNGTWYLNYAGTPEAIDYTSPQGTHYISKTPLISYVPDGNGGAASRTSEAYSVTASYAGSGSGGYFIIDPNGRITGYETGYKINGNFYINGTSLTPISSPATLNLFGAIYNFSRGYATYNFDAQNNPVIGYPNWTNSYMTSSGDSAQITYSEGADYKHLWVIDSYAGTFNIEYTDINNLTFPARYAPSFTKATLALNGGVISWHSGSIDAAGVVTDTYGPDSNGQTLVLRGAIRDVKLHTSNVDVILNGVSIGSCNYVESTENPFVNNSGDPFENPFNVFGFELSLNWPNRTDPFYAGSTLWVDGSPYVFQCGYSDYPFGNRRKDVYLASGGSVNISGTADSQIATVQVNHNGQIRTGTVDFSVGDGFYVDGLHITTLLPETGPPALWVGNVFYRRTAGTNDYTSFPSTEYTLKLGGGTPTAMKVSGNQGGGLLIGTFDVTKGIFIATLSDGSTVAGCSAHMDGSNLASGTSPDGYPPALRVGTEIWDYLGTALYDASLVNGAPGTAAYYGNARNAVFNENTSALPDAHHCLLKISLYQSVFTLTDYASDTSYFGLYNKQNHLLQSVEIGPVENEFAIPLSFMPIYGVDPNANDTPWMLSAPPFNNNMPGGGPATLLVDNQIWRYSGMGNGTALYQGYYQNQVLILAAPNAGGNRAITVYDWGNGVYGTYASGMLNDATGSTTLSSGQIVNFGTMTGGQVQPQNLATVSGDLSVPGNILNIGTLYGNASTPGATLQFSDSGSKAMFGTALGRAAAQWVWWRVNPNDSNDFVPTMVVDSAFGLAIYDPVYTSAATVKINPSSTSVSELPQLKLTHQQTLDEDGSVVTRALGDNRYLRADSNISFNVGIFSNGANTVAANSAAIGYGLQASSGQVVVGSYNDSSAASGNIFIVGSGASDSPNNALVVSTSGNTTLSGALTVTGAGTLTSATISDTLTVTGATTLSSATVSGTLTVGGQPVLTQDTADDLYIRADQVGGNGNSAILTQDAADTRYLRKGQVLRVAPAGDIEMSAEFKTIPDGVTPPTAP